MKNTTTQRDDKYRKAGYRSLRFWVKNDDFDSVKKSMKKLFNEKYNFYSDV